jgi:hypothetical protein
MPEAPPVTIATFSENMIFLSEISTYLYGSNMGLIFILEQY